jgi:3-oxoacyl-[acyl-carrier-protein] synthase II
MSIYIRAAQTISPQDTFPGKDIQEEIKIHDNYLKCVLPDFKNYFTPLQLRRMNRLVKSGNVCAIETIKEANIKKPDAIITGTGLGCVEDTEKFLHSMLQTNEGLLTPTAFIQSTHNTIGAQIALNFDCKGYNVLFAHKTTSFDNALLDSMLHLKEHEAANVLVGGFDEITLENYTLKKSIGQFKENSCTNLDIRESKTKGSIPGEGTTFFLLSHQPSEQDYAVLETVSIFSYCKSKEAIKDWFYKILKNHNLVFDDVDLILSGINGDVENDRIYNEILNTSFSKSIQSYYKHLCGEYDTASSFGMWFACKAIRKNYIPQHSLLNTNKRTINNVLIYNQDNMRNHCVILLKKSKHLH